MSCELVYDPALLTITGFTTSVPGATATYELPSAGLARFTVQSAAEFSAAAGEIIAGRISATRARHGAVCVEARAGPAERPGVGRDAGTPQLRPSRDDDGVHVAAYFGDTTANGLYSGSDVTLLQRVVVGSATGFAGYQLADPALIADINRSGTINGSDTTFVQRIVVGTPVSFVPPLPSGLPAAPAGGPDPRVFIPQDLQGQPGQTVTVPVAIEVTEPAGLTIGGFEIVVEYDAQRLTVTQAQLGDLFQGTDLAGLMTQPAPGTLIFSAVSPVGTPRFPLGTTGDLVTLTVAIAADAPRGPVALNLRASWGSVRTGVFDAALTDLVLNPPPTNAADDVVDGVLTVDPLDEVLTDLADDIASAWGASLGP